MEHYDDHYDGLTDQSDQALDTLRRKLCGSTVAAFLSSGETVTVEGANLDTLSYITEDRMLRVSNGIRTFVIPDVQYWTED